MARRKTQGFELGEKVVESQVVENSALVDFIPEAQPVVTLAEDERDHFTLPSDDHRDQILKCVSNLQVNFVAICQLLYQAQKLRRFESWGYTSFKEYAQRELGFRYGKAKALVNLWTHIGSKNQDMFDRLMSVGWDKANEISRVVNTENLDEWIGKAQHLSADDLKREVKNYILALVPKSAEEAVASEDAALESGAMGVTEEIHYRNFGFSYEQLQTVNEALVKVRQGNPEITSDAACLAAIASEFLASGGLEWEAQDEQNAIGVVSKLCDRHGLDAVVVRRQDSKILRGRETLDSIVTSVLEATV